MERALRHLETRFRHGPAGLLMVVGWGPGYFARRTDGDPPISRPVALARDERALMEDIDVCIHLAADDDDRLEGAIAALLGDGRAGMGDPLRLREVRRGFTGVGLPARFVRNDIPQDSPLLLGFHSGLRRNQATEHEITIEHGPLKGGTTMHVSHLALDLGAWYASTMRRGPRRSLGPTMNVTRAATFVVNASSDFERLPKTARSHGIVGHAEAAARERLDGRASAQSPRLRNHRWWPSRNPFRLAAT